MAKVTFAENVCKGCGLCVDACPKKIIAIAKDKIMGYYQPIYSVEKEGYNSAEALARRYDEKLGWISPDVFISIREADEKAKEIGRL